MGREEMVQKTKNYFKPWETIEEGNPQMILERRIERRDTRALPPLLIMQGSLDDNVLPAIQQKFSATYRAAGGDCQLEIFEGCTHEWVAEPGPHTDRAHAMVKDFIARQLRVLR
jgi:alpha-beta hydrolase superfamily lysophospholipase